MKLKIISLCLFVGASALFLRNFYNESGPRYKPRDERENKLDKTPQGIEGALKYYENLRKNVQTGKVELSDLMMSQNAVETFSKNFASKNKSASSLALQWDEMGPDVGGRTRAIIFDKNKTDRMYAGAVSGGLWLSDNGGLSWYRITGHNDLTDNLAICSMVQAANGDIYYGTGESFTGISSGSGAYTGTPGKGMWKSSDGGKTFIRLPSTSIPTPVKIVVQESGTLFTPNAFTAMIGDTIEWVWASGSHDFESIPLANGWDTLINGASTFKIIVTKTGGNIYRCTTHNVTGSFTAFATDTNTNNGSWSYVNSLAAHPTDPNRIYAATSGGLRVTYDGGQSWRFVRYSEYSPSTTPKFDEAKSDDVKVASDGSLIASITHFGYPGPNPPYTPDTIQVFYSPTGDTARFIQQVSDSGGGIVIITTTFDHGFKAGQEVQITATSSYSGSYIIRSVTSNTFSITHAFTGDDNKGAINTIVDITYRFPSYNNINASRLVFAFAPSNPNYIYCSAINLSRELLNLYQSKDKGASWTIIGAGGSSFNPYASQGDYDNLLGVFPDDPEHIIVGGLDMYRWTQKSGWDLISITFKVPGANLYVHADKHVVAFHPDYGKNNNKTLYVGTDGGISRSTDGGMTWQTANKNYNTTQFYAIGISGIGELAGGTQDNGNPYISPYSKFPKSEVYNLASGDGGFMQFSIIAPRSFFWESQEGAARRSPVGGPGGSPFLPGGKSGPWVTPIRLWESFNDTNSTETVLFTAKDRAYNIGETITVQSKNNKVPISYVLKKTMNVNDIVNIKDIVQTKMFVGLNDGVYMTKQALDFSVTPKWYLLSASPAGADDFAFSKDGDVLFVASGVNSFPYTLTRISGILSIQPTDPGYPTTPPNPSVISTNRPFNRLITSIAIDPNNANNLIVTLGQYGGAGGEYVYRSTNALTALSFEAISSMTASNTNFLPPMPMYASVIEKHNANTVIIGGEYGIYTTSNAFYPDPAKVIWSEDNSGFPRVPTFMLAQQTHPNSWGFADTTGIIFSGLVINSGVIYAGTHGRSAFKCTRYADPPAVTNVEPVSDPSFNMNLSVHPNPSFNGNATVSFTLDKKSEVTLQIMGIQGKIVKVITKSSHAQGFHSRLFSTNDLKEGIYFINISAEGMSKTIKFVVL